MPLKAYWGHHIWWEDLPENAKQAARVLGYTKEIWDGDEYSSYHKKVFGMLSCDEKRAALFIGLPVLDDKFKNLYWEQVDATTQKHASALGFDQHKWDHDWSISDMEVERLYWNELTEEQQDAAEYFGYSEGLWNEDGQDQETFGMASPDGPTEEEAPHGFAESDDEEPDAPLAPGDSSEGEPAPTPSKHPNIKKPRKKILITKLFGGDGNGFDHGAHKHIDQLTIFADGNTVFGIAAKYFGQPPRKTGPSHGQESTLRFRPGEFITSVKVRATNHVHSLTFMTNRGTKLGPCGGEQGEEFEIPAPEGMVLCGLVGKTGKPTLGRTRINAIAFKWGPNPKV